MSSILKALRKIEEEKRVASHAAPDLRVDQGGASVKSRSLLPLVVGIVLGIVCAGFFVVWQSSDAPEVATPAQPKLQETVTASRQASDASRQQKIIAVKKVDTENYGTSSAKTSSTLQTPLISQPSDNIIEAKKPAKPVLSVTDSNVAEPDSPIGQQVLVEGEAAPVAKVKAQHDTQEVEMAKQTTSILPAPEADPALLPLPEGVSLQVSEIFFQEESANSIALVNDLPVMVGTHVESAVVHEIRPDTVIFKIGQATYSVGVIPPSE